MTDLDAHLKLAEAAKEWADRDLKSYRISSSVRTDKIYALADAVIELVEEVKRLRKGGQSILEIDEKGNVTEVSE